jgi:uncharacterized protein (TIGR00297 family)
MIWGFLIAAAIALIAFWMGLLSRSGAAAATALGTLVFGLGGLGWAVLLVVFFASSSGLTRLFGRRKGDLSATFSKGGRRDAGQVLANGGLAGLIVVLHALRPDWAWTWIAYSGVLAAVNADTWATELGVLSRTAPRLITTLRPVMRGTSGGVSLTGTLAALAGALLIGLSGGLLWPDPSLNSIEFGSGLPALNLVIRIAGAVAVAGLLGSLVDSLLGATVQAIYFCPVCEKETERHPLHTCGAPTELHRGLAWLNNDGVNALCSLAGGVAAILFASL